MNDKSIDDRDEKLIAKQREIESPQKRPDIEQSGSGGLAVDGSVAGGDSATVIGGDVGRDVVVVKEGGTIIYRDDPPIPMSAVDEKTALAGYLHDVISQNRYLQLQGIRARGRLVNIELENIYITLKATSSRKLADREKWLDGESKLALGDRTKLTADTNSETMQVKVEQALHEHKHLVVLGIPGSGKTTLLRYLAFCYGQDRAQGSCIVNEKLGLDESGFLPVLLPLRNFGDFLRAKYPANDGTEGHSRLLEFLSTYLANRRVTVPEHFFDQPLQDGRAIFMFDGMDKVGDFDLRRRVARIIEGFTQTYVGCRVVVTSRIVGYQEGARLGEGFATTTVNDFTLKDVERFLGKWHRLVAIGQHGVGKTAEHSAAEQTRQLLEAIKDNQRVRELAINPLMLTVIALVHRDRVKLPERRAELYAEAIDVLLGKWDEARGVGGFSVLQDREFDTTDKRLLLESIALAMHERGEKEIEADALEKILVEAFAKFSGDHRAAQRAASSFLQVIQQRTGLLLEAGPGNYRFSHLTFQEYLAAVAVAEREDYIAFASARCQEPFWREVILLIAGYLSTKNSEKTNRLIRAIFECRQEPELFYNRVLAAQCIRDCGEGRVDRQLAEEIVQSLRGELERPTSGWKTLVNRWIKLGSPVDRRRAAVKALGKIESSDFGGDSPFWSLPYGEPAWIPIPEGKFFMGSDDSDGFADESEKPLHRLKLPPFSISQTPITNAQYEIYANQAGISVPEHWDSGKPPAGRSDHPVVGVSWYEALDYCRWLSKSTAKQITLPSEAQWEKAARGDQDSRIYPWGDEFDSVKSNSFELGLEDTSSVGVFRHGKSAYGCLDMAGNVWEWTRSLWGEDWENAAFKYPYVVDDGRENEEAADSVLRCLRGGAFSNSATLLRCACRDSYDPHNRFRHIGFRVVLLPSNSGL